jgi:hypothetical protein
VTDTATDSSPDMERYGEKDPRWYEMSRFDTVLGFFDETSSCGDATRREVFTRRRGEAGHGDLTIAASLPDLSMNSFHIPLSAPGFLCGSVVS